MIQTYATWAKANDKKCRRMVGWVTPVTAGKMSRQLFHITDRRTILMDAGFRLLGGTSRNKDRPTPRKSVSDMVDGWATELSEVVYYDSIEGEIIVWGK